jgi:hypothetical protein
MLVPVVLVLMLVPVVHAGICHDGSLLDSPFLLQRRAQRGRITTLRWLKVDMFSLLFF